MYCGFCCIQSCPKHLPTINLPPRPQTAPKGALKISSKPSQQPSSIAPTTYQTCPKPLAKNFLHMSQTPRLKPPRDIRKILITKYFFQGSCCIPSTSANSHYLLHRHRSIPYIGHTYMYGDAVPKREYSSHRVCSKTYNTVKYNGCKIIQ